MAGLSRRAIPGVVAGVNWRASQRPGSGRCPSRVKAMHRFGAGHSGIALLSCLAVSALRQIKYIYQLATVVLQGGIRVADMVLQSAVPAACVPGNEFFSIHQIIDQP